MDGQLDNGRRQANEWIATLTCVLATPHARPLLPCPPSPHTTPTPPPPPPPPRKFDEGEGYRVRDETGHGHHLIMSGEPRWTVVPWLSFCGDGYVQGLEECDDGNDRDGDGCSSTVRGGGVGMS